MHAAALRPGSSGAHAGSRCLSRGGVGVPQPIVGAGVEDIRTGIAVTGVTGLVRGTTRFRESFDAERLNRPQDGTAIHGLSRERSRPCYHSS